LRADHFAQPDRPSITFVKGEGDLAASRDLSPAVGGVRSGKPPWPPERHQRLLVLAEAGLSGREIAGELGVSRNAVLGYCHRHGVSLPLTQRKRKLQGRRKSAASPRAKATSKFRPGHPAFRSRPFGQRAFSDDQIAIAIAARLAGASRPKASRMIGAGQQIISQWEQKPELMAKGRALFEIARADAAQRAAERREREAAAAEARRLTVERTNWPILGRMPERHRAMMERRVAGESLQEVGDAFGVTRERVRQIEVKWRLRGLIVPTALHEVSDVARDRFGPKPTRPAKVARRPYNISDAERARRSERMRQTSATYWATRR
jgi:DNA-directed RNA polymerase specialized sigma24 family protein